jgi:hypothetical protein
MSLLPNMAEVVAEWVGRETVTGVLKESELGARVILPNARHELRLDV